MYELDAKAAKESDKIGGYLKDSGKYTGKFIRAEKLISANKGTHGVGFTFMSDTGQSTRFDIWTKNAQNEQLMGYKTLMAIMTCVKARALTVKKEYVERYDYDAKERYDEQADVFPELMDKDIGLLLRNTEYEKMKDGQKTGDTGWRLELYGVFEASTELTAGEIIDKKKAPEQLAKMLSTLSDRPLKKGSGSTPARQQTSSGGPSNFEEDSDIPFAPIPRRALTSM